MTITLKKQCLFSPHTLIQLFFVATSATTGFSAHSRADPDPQCVRGQPDPPNKICIYVDGNKLDDVRASNRLGLFGGLNPGRTTDPAVDHATKVNGCDGSEGNPSSPSSPRPVKIVTGEKHLTQVDLRNAGIYGFELIRTYRSSERVGRLFGANWPTNYEPALIERSEEVQYTAFGVLPAWFALVESDGTRWKFTFDEVYGQGCPPDDPDCGGIPPRRDAPWKGPSSFRVETDTHNLWS